MNTKKKHYEKPTMQVVFMRDDIQLLAGSVTGDIDTTMDNEWTENEW